MFFADSALFRLYGLQGTKAVKILERALGKISAYIVTVVLTELGIFLLYKGVFSFLIL